MPEGYTRYRVNADGGCGFHALFGEVDNSKNHLSTLPINRAGFLETIFTKKYLTEKKGIFIDLCRKLNPDDMKPEGDPLDYVSEQIKKLTTGEGSKDGRGEVAALLADPKFLSHLCFIFNHVDHEFSEDELSFFARVTGVGLSILRRGVDAVPIALSVPSTTTNPTITLYHCRRAKLTSDGDDWPSEGPNNHWDRLIPKST
ncbi:hypothetical protein DID77_03625 [Candidatus Marinamargulisbacteria bacterium SCGC AG-439-L15]|nr:hypothetical protein DID77_03625 [Candidatus Marinamargulisbacteria bacterium SCGC AG-439-L15]